MTLNSTNALSAKSCAAVASLFVVLAVAVNCGGLILPYLAAAGIFLACLGAFGGAVVLMARHEKFTVTVGSLVLSALSLVVSNLWYKAATVGLGPDHIIVSPIGSILAVFAVGLGAACCALHIGDGTHKKLSKFDRYALFSAVYDLGNLVMLAIIYACLGGK